MSDVRDLGLRFVAAARPCDASCEHRHCAFSGEVKLVRDLLYEMERQDAIIGRLSEYAEDLRDHAEFDGNYANNPYASAEHAIQAVESENVKNEVASELEQILNSAE